MACARTDGCIRARDHGGRCYIRRAGIAGPTNPYAEAMRRVRATRLHGVDVTIAPPLRDAALAVAEADPAYEVALHTGGPLAARAVLKDQCVPARQAYRLALDAAAMLAEVPR